VCARVVSVAVVEGGRAAGLGRWWEEGIEIVRGMEREWVRVGRRRRRGVKKRLDRCMVLGFEVGRVDCGCARCKFPWLREWMRLRQDDMGGFVLVDEAT
jgi:hypothetical protein